MGSTFFFGPWTWACWARQSLSHILSSSIYKDKSKVSGYGMGVRIKIRRQHVQTYSFIEDTVVGSAPVFASLCPLCGLFLYSFVGLLRSFVAVFIVSFMSLELVLRGCVSSIGQWAVWLPSNAAGVGTGPYLTRSGPDLGYFAPNDLDLKARALKLVDFILVFKGGGLKLVDFILVFKGGGLTLLDII